MTQAQMLRLGMLLQDLLRASWVVQEVARPGTRRLMGDQAYPVPGSLLMALEDARSALARWCESAQAPGNDTDGPA